MGKVKNYYHEEISNRDGEADEPYPCSSCNEPTRHGTLCDACLAECREIARKETDARTLALHNEREAIPQMPNLLEANRKYMDTAKSITATADELEAIWGGDSYEIDK